MSSAYRVRSRLPWRGSPCRCRDTGTRGCEAGAVASALGKLAVQRAKACQQRRQRRRPSDRLKSTLDLGQANGVEEVLDIGVKNSLLGEMKTGVACGGTPADESLHALRERDVLREPRRKVLLNKSEALIGLIDRSVLAPPSLATFRNLQTGVERALILGRSKFLEVGH